MGKSKKMYSKGSFNKKELSFDKFYSHGSVAYETAALPAPSLPDSIPAPKPLPEKRRESLPLKELIRKKREIVHGKAKCLLLIVSVFAGCVVLMCVSARVENQRVVNNRLKDSLYTLQAENSAIEADMSDELSIDYIKSEAINRLGMVEPQDYQIVHVNVPEQSYTISYGDDYEKVDENRSVLESIIGMFKGE